MDLMDKDWCDLFVYTVNGSAIFRITRDFEYWRLCYSVLAEFWWEHLIPAKHALWDRGDHAEAEKHRPSEQHAYTQQLVDRSKEMVRRVTPVWVPADGTQDGVTR